MGQAAGPPSEASLNHFNADSGEIGMDPWGRPFHFKIFKGSGSKSKVLVWSSGPNGIADTEEAQIDSNADKSSPAFRGDDLGVMVINK